MRSEMLDQALSANSEARKTYESLSDYKKREYAEHIESAKQQATKQRRLVKSLSLLKQGLGLNDKYRKK
ncbi:MAG: YdeI/OmpD-associated family protein [Owenweeksia sp.]|nr:YdeI/OmpD-associated family protein [Owenweeksia sp.]